VSDPRSLPCIGLMGFLFGHATEPRFHLSEPGPARVTFLLEHPEFSPESELPPHPQTEAARVYAGEACTRCGRSFPADPAFGRQETGALPLMEALLVLRGAGMRTVFDPQLLAEKTPAERRRWCFIACLEITGELVRGDPLHLLLERGEVDTKHPLTQIAEDVSGGETARFALPSYARSLGIPARKGKRYQDIALASMILYEHIAGMTEEFLEPGDVLLP
jgi:hypothetical protein